MTMFICEIDSASKSIRYANAGHISPLLIPLSSGDPRLPKSQKSAAKKRVLPLIGSGSVLGFDGGPSFEERELKLSDGDRILFYTDGLIECLGVDGKQLRPMELRKQVAELSDDPSGPNLCESLVHAARSRLGDVPRDDDITVVVAQLSPEASQRAHPSAGVA